MTILQCVAIRDVKVAFQRPFFAPTIGSAIRAFSDEVQRIDANNEMSRHPADYALYHLGEYNDDTGAITPLSNPQLLIEAQQCLSTTSLKTGQSVR